MTRFLSHCFLIRLVFLVWFIENWLPSLNRENQNKLDHCLVRLTAPAGIPPHTHKIKVVSLFNCPAHYDGMYTSFLSITVVGSDGERIRHSRSLRLFLRGIESSTVVINHFYYLEQRGARQQMKENHLFLLSSHIYSYAEGSVRWRFWTLKRKERRWAALTKRGWHCSFWWVMLYTPAGEIPNPFFFVN